MCKDSYSTKQAEINIGPENNPPPQTSKQVQSLSHETAVCWEDVHITGAIFPVFKAINREENLMVMHKKKTKKHAHT